MWCHLLLFMPVAGLALFFVLPWPLALAGYLPIAAASFFIFHLSAKALRLPVQTGQESLLGTRGEVVGPLAPGGLASHIVRFHGELWSVRAREPLQAGDCVCITGFDGVRPLVERLTEGMGGGTAAAAKCLR